jgi:hypothetical protein
MNPGLRALETLVEMGVLKKRSLPIDGGPVQYFADRTPKKNEWADVVGLLHRASSWCGTRGLSVTCGSKRTDVVFQYRAEEDSKS